MRFLGITASGHDSNMCLYDNGDVRYHKFEREFAVKHMYVSNLDMLMVHAERVFGIPVSEYDAVGMLSDGIIIQTAQQFNKNAFIVDHHTAHAMSGWMINENPDVVITNDGVGDFISFSVWRDGECLYKKNAEDGSIGNEIDAASIDIGIVAKEGGQIDLAGKFMGLQSYGEVHEGYLEKLHEHYSAFGDFCDSWNRETWDLYHNNSVLYKNKQLDRIATLHKFWGDMVMEIFDKYAKPEDSIIYAGGVAQNVLWNTELKKKYPKLDVIPHSGDEGLSFGIVEWLRKKYNQPLGTIPGFPYRQNDENLGVASVGTIEKTALALSQGKVVAWVQGNSEIGPRALGNRSILMDPTALDGKERANNVKSREHYRPFGASVLESHANDFFDDWFVDKYMVYTAKPKKIMPAITHVDGTCRVQTVGEENPAFKALLERFYQMTGCAVVLNTSLNPSGRPTVSTRSQVFDVFSNSNIDILVIGDEMYEKAK